MLQIRKVLKIAIAILYSLRLKWAKASNLVYMCTFLSSSTDFNSKSRPTAMKWPIDIKRTLVALKPKSPCKGPSSHRYSHLTQKMWAVRKPEDFSKSA